MNSKKSNKSSELDSKMSKIMGSKLKELRESSNMTLQYVADRVISSKNRATVQHWEAGRANPDLVKLKKMCDLYGVDVIDFLNQVYTEVYRGVV